MAVLSYSIARQEPRRRADKIEIVNFNSHLKVLLEQHESKLESLSRSPALLDWTRDRIQPASSDKSQSLTIALRGSLAEILNSQTHFLTVAAFDQNQRQLFFAENGSNQLTIREKDFLPGQLQPDERSWTATTPVRSPATSSPLGPTIQISVPIPTASQTRSGVITAKVDLVSLVREAAEKGKDQGRSYKPSGLIVTDDYEKIVYHPNSAFLHQPVAAVNVKSTPEEKIPGLNLYVATLDTPGPKSLAEIYGFLGIGLFSLLLATIGAYLLANVWERRTRGMEKVTAGVAAIARGDLDHRIEALSSDAIRPISDNLNLMTAQLREQIAREAEARQFQSFVRLSAMLTHDLKNAIEALSLIVSNMERHFDNEAFRADAMKSLNLATQNLRSLVNRLTNPVTTLSGEYKRPQPVDLVPMLNRVIKLTAAPALNEGQIRTSLPETLPALADAERIEKVIENLVLNAIEAMAGTEGKLSIAAGLAETGKVFFSVSDNGPGMSSVFIERQLFRPFATTKKRGVGLGLYTCREVVRTNGGTIEVDSREGAGTTFRVVLPSPTIEKV